MMRLTPDRADFAIVSFEGPDEYSRAGGLAVRVRDLAETLAELGHDTHLYFVGDPNLPGVERDGNLTLHRWCQWISAHHPGGVYDGEWGKMQDLTSSLPFALADQTRAAASRGAVTVIMTEDWQTAPVAMNASRVLHDQGLLGHAIPVWTANNLYGLDGINFGALSDAAHVLTISRYMKHAMRRFGVNPLVTQNGIAPSAVTTVPAATIRSLRAGFGEGIALFKIGRFSPDKGWTQAIEAAALLKHGGARVRMLLRGDKLPYGGDVLMHARIHGLNVTDLIERYNTPAQLSAALAAQPDVDVFNLRSFLPDSLLAPLYASVDAVLANSVFEPFGLVGLEVMGAGGCVVVGSTGEEYAEPGVNAVVLDTEDPREIVFNLRRLASDTDALKSLKRRARETAKAYVWPVIVNELFDKLDYVALARNVEVQA
jgi:glycosyltransferase involved in cell wall biosynthesis